jgi:AAA+ superfamily predicted ATPase
MSEQDPAQGREWGNPPQISFDVRNREEIKGLTLCEDVSDIALETEVPLPIEELRMTIEGSLSSEGAYSLETHILLAESDDREAKARQFIAGFVHNKAGVLDSVEEGTYLITSPRWYQYRVMLNETHSAIILETAGTVDEEHLATGDRLYVHKDDFDPAFEDYIDTTEQLLRDLYLFSGTEKVALHVSVTCPEPESELELEETPEEQPMPSYIIKPKRRLDELAGIDDIKNRLMDIVDAMRYPEIMEAYMAERHHGIFLYGPAGTGKTTLAEAIATEVGADLRIVKSSDIYGMYMGQSERQFQLIMNQSRAATQPLVLLFDEVDAIVRPNGGATYATVAGLFKQEIGRLCDDNKNVIVIATSNKQPDEIEEALFRDGRFDAHIYVPLPDEAGRSAIFGSLVWEYVQGAQRDIFDTEEINYERLSLASEDMNGAKIKEIIRGLVAAKALHEARTQTKPSLIDTQQILSAIERKRTTQA